MTAASGDCRVFEAYPKYGKQGEAMVFDLSPDGIDSIPVLGRAHYTHAGGGTTPHVRPGRDEYGEESYYAVGPGGGKLVGPRKAKWIGKSLYRPARYTVETWNGTGWGPATLHESSEYTAVYDPSAKVRITWLLDIWTPPGTFLMYN